LYSEVGLIKLVELMTLLRWLIEISNPKKDVLIGFYLFLN